LDDNRNDKTDEINGRWKCELLQAGAHVRDETFGPVTRNL
jgi:hypothetical protein